MISRRSDIVGAAVTVSFAVSMGVDMRWRHDVD